MAVAAHKRRKVKQGSGNFLSATDALKILQQSPSCAPALRSVRKILLAGGPTAACFAEDLLANGFLQLVPSILRHSRTKGVAAGIEILGAISVSSLSAHRKVVSDKNAIRALAEILELRLNVELHTIACHAVIDLLITPFGCEALNESGVMRHLLHLLCWIGDLSEGAQKFLVDEGSHPPKSLDAGETASNSRKQCERLSHDIQSDSRLQTKIVFSALRETAFCEEVEELVTTASTAVSVLIRNLGIEDSSQSLCREVLDFLRRFWHTLLRKDQILLKSTAADEEPIWTCNRGTRQLVAKCVVQLAMEIDSNCSRKLSLQQGLFENTDFNQSLFFGEYWEQTPMIVSRKLPCCLSALSKTFTTLAAVVNNVLAWFVCCPPANADQLDSLCLLDSFEGCLGEPMISGQDIRIVKTVLLEPDAVSPLTQVSERTSEVHYCGTSVLAAGQVARYVHPREISEAIEKGYTVAIKGMELRCSSIADIADCLARQCGQPSVGVNLYVTPANAQGLDLHYDDHCVFVCQLVGRKIWNVYPPQKFLPRLYSCRTLNRGALNHAASTVYNLDEGDILYIPRGFPHRAHCAQPEDGSGTCLPGSRPDRSDEPNIRQESEESLNDVDHSQNLGDSIAENSGSSRFGSDQFSNMPERFSPGLYSLHLTFGVEVEPPFEWEGLIHVALRIWAEQKRQTLASSHSRNESFNRYGRLCKGLLHIAINLLGEKELALRKACMIAAEPSRLQHRSSQSREGLPFSEAGSKAFICEQNNSLVCDICDPISLEYFQKLLEVVAKKANFAAALALQQAAPGEYIGYCSGGMEWLQNATCSAGQSATSTAEPVALGMSTIQSDQFKDANMQEVEQSFSNMKEEFGKASLFHRAAKAFGSIHTQYRTIRKKYTDGMLALHENSFV